MGRSDLGRRSVTSEGMRPPDDGVSSGPNTFIWGTNVSVEETQRAFNDFFDEWVDPEEEVQQPQRPKLVEQRAPALGASG